MPEKSPPFLENQQALQISIARALIGLAPEEWNRACLAVSTDVKDGVETMSHQISNPEGKVGVVFPSQELCTLTRQLFLLFKEPGQQPWKKAIYEASLNPDGNWGFACKFEYAS